MGWVILGLIALLLLSIIIFIVLVTSSNQYEDVEELAKWYSELHKRDKCEKNDD